MKTSDFDYRLPPELIAQAPLAERAQARMMVVDRTSGRIAHRQVRDLPALLRAGDLLVVNDTRAFPARVFGWRRDTRGKIEVLFVEEIEPGVWLTLCRTKSALAPKTPLALANDKLRAEVVRKTDDGKVVLRVAAAQPVLDVLESEGSAPVPPYIKRDAAHPELARLDRERYQTVFAQTTGAVAAPTAGLHFTPELMGQLAAAGVGHCAVTLHVGPGTFRPVKSERIEDHTMDGERYVVGAEAARLVQAARDGGGRVVGVGSTVVRTLETVVAEHGRVVPCAGRSGIFIHPPFAFRAVAAVLTNFHLPCSTLLMLVSAFAGLDLVRRAYAAAVDAKYRFFSYGDCMLIL